MSRVPRERRAARRRALAACLAFLGFAGCRSYAVRVEDADREVYELVTARRAEIVERPEAFSIEPAVDNLRLRLLSGDVSEVGPLRIVDCLEIAAENNREYQARRESLYLAALDLTLAQWRFHWQETGFLSGFLDGSGDEGGPLAGNAGLGLAKLFGTGARILSDIGLTLARDISNGDGWSAVSNFALSVTQPLLAGSGRAVVMEGLTQAERNLLYEVRSYERFRRSLAVDVASRIYDLLQQMDTVRNEQLNFENLAILTERNRALAEAGRLSDIELDQALQDELRSRNRLIDLRASLERQLDDFNLFLGLPVETMLTIDVEEGQRLREQGLQELDLVEDVVIAYALGHRLDYLTQLDRVDDAERRVVVAADGLRAALDVTASVSGTSRENKPLSYDFDDLGWTLGVAADLPLDRLPERNDYRAALIAVQATRRDADELGDLIRADLRDALRTVESARETYVINEEAVRLAERRIESTNLNLEAGRATTRDLLEAQEDLRDARDATTDALIQYTLSKLSFFLDMELIRLSGEGIEIAELQETGEPQP